MGFADDSSSSLEAFEVVAVYGDYLVCAPADALNDEGVVDVDDLSDERIYVAKPWILRKTPFDGMTWNEIEYEYSETGGDFSRTAYQDRDTDDEVSETQIITPDYMMRDTENELSGEIILAVERTTGVETDDGVAISWEDVNTAGRCWATIGVT